MKIEIQFVNDVNGNTQAVQMPLTKWERVLNNFDKHEQGLKLKSYFKEVFEQVTLLINP